MATNTKNCIIVHENKHEIQCHNIKLTVDNNEKS